MSLPRTIAALDGWKRFGLALVAGAILTLGFAPTDLWPIGWISFGILVWLLDGARTGRTAFMTAWAFGWGHFITGFYWIAVSFFVDADKFAWLSPLPVLGLPAFLAVYPGLAGYLAWRFGHGMLARVLLLAPLWYLVEILRGWVLTGFPWNPLGLVWMPLLPVAQIAAIIGVQGLGMITVLLFALPAALVAGFTRKAAIVCCLLVACAFALGGAYGTWRMGLPTEPAQPGIMLRIVQPNIDQQMKWAEDLRQRHFDNLLALTLAPGPEKPTHIIWPETAVPYIIEYDAPRRAALAEAAQTTGPVLLGVIRRSPPGETPLTIWNSLQVVDRNSNIVATYDKRHLVPFGEFLPARRWLSPLGLDAIAASGLDFTSGSGSGTIDVEGLPKARVLICYEAIFPREMLSAEFGQPEWLLNVTNDAWFGRASGPYQHFAEARMRAIENGLPMIRSANTGISAVVDGYGRVLKRLGLGERGIIDSPLPATAKAETNQNKTIYGRFGEAIAVLLGLVIAAAGAMLRFGFQKTR